MPNPDRREPFAGMPPQDLRHDLSELRKGMIRISPEPFAMSLRRFRYNQVRLEDAERRYGREDPGLEGRINRDRDNLRALVARGPGVKGEIVIFDTIRIPLPRRERFAEHQVDTEELADIAASEADELLNRFPDGQIPEAIYDAVLHDEEVVRDLTISR